MERTMRLEPSTQTIGKIATGPEYKKNLQWASYGFHEVEKNGQILLWIWSQEKLGDF